MQTKDYNPATGKRSRNPFSYVTSFSKIITMAWLVIWVESILFEQAAAWLGFGDAMAITAIGQTITEIGAIICGFYFSTKCLENIFKGYEEWRLDKQMIELDNADADAVPCDPEDEHE